ncbi:MAG: HAD-IA family hydrolase [Pseudomonadota bacterium]
MISSVIFDVGNVLVDWSVQSFLRAKGYDESQAADLVGGTLNLEWHSVSDLGVPLDENVRQRKAIYPQDADALALYRDKWHETVVGSIDGTVELLQRLAKANVDLYAITNFPADQFGPFYERFGFMNLFQSIVVSGELGLKKPDPRIYALALDRFGCDADASLFIDDRRENCLAAARFGIQTHVFQGPECLAKDLIKRGLLAG